MSPALPIYHQVKREIQDWIASKEYGPGDKMPSEADLAKTFKAARMTVRRAIDLLIQEGILLRKNRHGTFVTSNEELLGSLSLDFNGLMDGLAKQAAESKAVSVTLQRLSTPRAVREKLKTNDDFVYKVERTRALNDRIFAFTVNYLPDEIGRMLDENILYQKPLLEHLKDDLGVGFDEAIQTIEASFSDQHVSEMMGIPNGSPILYVERVMYGEKKQPLEIVQTYYRGDAYKYVVRLKVDTENKSRHWMYLS